MLYQTGTIVDVRGSRARVEFERAPACSGCAGGQGCGLGPLLAMFRRADEKFFLDLPVGAGRRVQVGDRVRTALPASRLVQGASVAYLLPMVGVMFGAWLATALFPEAGDLGALAGTVAGLVAGWGGLVVTGKQAGVTLIH